MTTCPVPPASSSSAADDTSHPAAPAGPNSVKQYRAVGPQAKDVNLAIWHTMSARNWVLCALQPCRPVSILYAIGPGRDESANVCRPDGLWYNSDDLSFRRESCTVAITNWIMLCSRSGSPSTGRHAHVQLTLTDMICCDTIPKWFLRNGNSTTQHNRLCVYQSRHLPLQRRHRRFFGKLSYVTRCRSNLFINRSKLA